MMNHLRVLVTGANGYIGNHVVSELLRRGFSVTACDLSFERVDSRAQRLDADLFAPGSDIYERAGRPEALIHLAWRDGFAHNSGRHIQDLPLHYAFLRQMADAGVRYLSVMGSMHEIGYWEGAIDENTPANPLSCYGIAKNALRQLCGLLSAGRKDLHYHWLRGYYIHGDDEQNHSIFTKLLAADARGDELFPFTSGKNQYDFEDVHVLARQIVSATMDERHTGVVNCCSGRPVSLKDEVERFIAEHGLSIRLNYGAFPDRPYDSPALWGDSTRIQAILREEEQA